MEEKDKQAFIEDFKKTDIKNKLDMWYFAIDQVAFWEEILSDMSTIAQPKSPLKKTIKTEC